MSWQFMVIACWFTFSTVVQWYAVGKGKPITPTVTGGVVHAIVSAFILWSLWVAS